MSRRRSTALKDREAVPVFAALADPTRLGLLRRLSADGPLSITRLSAGTGVTRQAITRHLQALEAAGLVRDLRRGPPAGFLLRLVTIAGGERHPRYNSAQRDAAVRRPRSLPENTYKTVRERP